MSDPTLIPRLVVRDAPRAIDFYTRVFGATERARYTLPSGAVVQAELSVGDATFALTEEAPDWQTLAPPALSGSPVILSLRVDDPDATCARAVELGAEVVFPIADQFYGRREGRIRDPFGHLWILSKVVEALDPAEIQRRMDAFGAED